MAVSIKKAGSADISKFSDIIRHAYKNVAQRFGLTPKNCPKHPSNFTGEWVQSDLDSDLSLHKGSIENLKQWIITP